MTADEQALLVLALRRKAERLLWTGRTVREILADVVETCVADTLLVAHGAVTVDEFAAGLDEL